MWCEIGTRCGSASSRAAARPTPARQRRARATPPSRVPTPRRAGAGDQLCGDCRFATSPRRLETLCSSQVGVCGAVADALVSTGGAGAYDGSLTKRDTGRVYRGPTALDRAREAVRHVLPSSTGTSMVFGGRPSTTATSMADLCGSRSTARPASALEINRPEPSTDRCQQTLGARSGSAVGSGSGRG
jgi:hypothetical protein